MTSTAGDAAEVAPEAGAAHLTVGAQLTLLSVAQCTTMLGYSVVLPFLPFVVERLGVHERAAIAVWSGMLVALLNVGNAFAAPAWGRLADRRGRKPMVIRAMCGGGALMAACAAAPDVWVLGALFLLLGSMAGSQAATMTLAAAVAPANQVAASFGALQSASFVGTSLGPAAGALIVPFAGPRPSLVVAGAFPLLSGLAVLAFVREPATARSRVVQRPSAHRLLANAGRIREALALLLICLLAQASLFGVIASLPLRIRAASSPGHAALLVGVAAALQAGGAAAGALIATRRLRHRPMPAITAGALLGACTYAAVAATATPGALLALAALGGLAVGGILPLANAILGDVTPAEVRGEIFGYSATAMAVGGAFAPALATSLIPRWGTPAPFLMIAVVDLMLAAVAVRAYGIERRGAAAHTTVEMS